MIEILFAVSGTLTIAACLFCARRWSRRAALSRQLAAEMLVYAEGIEAMHWVRVHRREQVEHNAGVHRG